jgi:hypothetical protein
LRGRPLGVRGLFWLEVVRSLLFCRKVQSVSLMMLHCLMQWEKS